jgi:endoglucanase Acf2
LPLLGRTKYQEYEVTLVDGEELWLEYVYAPDLEHAAWSALELSKNRDAQLKNVKLTDDW